MSILNIQLPNSLQSNPQERAEREGISIDQFIATAVAEQMSALMTESYLAERAKRGRREKYEAVLAQVPDVAPEEYDKRPRSE